MKNHHANNALIQKFTTVMNRICSHWYSERESGTGKVTVKFLLKKDFEKEFEGTYKRPDYQMFI